MNQLINATLINSKLLNIKNMRFLFSFISFFSIKFSRSLLTQVTLCLFTLNLIGCASQEPIPIPVIKPAPVAAPQDESLKKEIDRLEKIIAEKDKVIRDQKIKQNNQAQTLQEVNKEAARTQVKLHRLATKSSTASAIAETEVSLERLKQAKIPAADQILQVQAHHLVETASILFTQDQFAAAMNYVAQAKQLIDLITHPNRKKISDDDNSFFEFNTPIQLHTKTNVNIRTAPNASAKIISMLKKDTKVSVNASLGSWLRVQSGRDQGWVFSIGLEVRGNNTP
ncbi:SH3 domain-containing protein [Nitrosomonas ureae]|uniref:SH3 domain-containing protein n=1 Tax=Nitrosomonas ureae TaxID=44577 RepID=A0A1H5UL40_9PROT|nr:SH3 domain-containing protein [Nitrosomonas ureae]SEF74977.1 SH3 domain-containing protein [Nitrosomonas ureae]